jgi:dienelactone hydrolase
MQRALIPAVLAAPIVLTATVSAVPAGGATQEAVELKAGDGHRIPGTFHKPNAERCPGVLLIHDAGGDRAQLDSVAERLVKQGFGVLAIDLRGHGASRSDKLDWAKLSDNDKKATWSFAQRDIDAAAEWLLAQPTIHSTSLSLVGYGSGCALAVRHAKSDENVECIVLLAPNAADYGFDVRADIQSIEGLPTYVVTPKDAEGERMAQEANASSGYPYVELFISPPKLTTPLEDKGLPSRVSKWLAEKAMPKKGRATAASSK